MIKPDEALSISNILYPLEKLRMDQLNFADWQTEKLNFIPLRGSLFANSEADFDLDVEVNKFLANDNDRKVLLLMGDSGSGKSLYTQGLIIKLWQSLSAQSPIPIWISLPSLKNPTQKAIEETFSRFEFTIEQIETLRQTRSFIFILDAYDEIHTTKNLYVTNQLDRWQAKVIFTCRREYLYNRDNYKSLFMPFVGEKTEHLKYEEMIVRLFNTKQTQSYIEQYIKSPEATWKNLEQYQKAIEDISGLKELIQTPFMLKLTMQALPQLVEKYAKENNQQKKRVTQAALYDVFIEQWFIRQENKLKDSGLIQKDDDIRPEFWNYAKEFAQAMHKQNVTQVKYEVNDDDNIFEEEAIIQKK